MQMKTFTSCNSANFDFRQHSLLPYLPVIFHLSISEYSYRYNFHQASSPTLSSHLIQAV